MARLLPEDQLAEIERAEELSARQRAARRESICDPRSGYDIAPEESTGDLVAMVGKLRAENADLRLAVSREAVELGGENAALRKFLEEARR